ncbi:MAG: hypothetical protein L0Y55_02825 [Anaerolineales bacterium]|nr:hypothetical protein [Anaerolineales bacterium]
MTDCFHPSSFIFRPLDWCFIPVDAPTDARYNVTATCCAVSQVPVI